MGRDGLENPGHNDNSELKWCPFKRDGDCTAKMDGATAGGDKFYKSGKDNYR
jgi:hypothetical protein